MLKSMEQTLNEPDVINSAYQYRRVLLKLSGEALMGQGGFGMDPKRLEYVACQVTQLVQAGVEVALVIGGGNMFRGKTLSQSGVSRVTADHMGMLATIMNAVAFRDVLERMGQSARVLSAVSIPGIVDGYHSHHAVSALKARTVVIFAAGTGNPLFTTDSAACLRAIEIEADVVLKATKVDGIYSADPLRHIDAARYAHLTYDAVLQNNLEVMDLTAICLCRDHNMPVIVFNLNQMGAIEAIMRGQAVGTRVGPANPIGEP